MKKKNTKLRKEHRVDSDDLYHELDELDVRHKQAIGGGTPGYYKYKNEHRNNMRFCVFVALCMFGIVIYHVITFIQERQVKHEQWEVFKIEHDCRIVQKIDGVMDIQPVIGIATNGVAAIGMVNNSTSNKVVWLCDDGITYWKNR